ncbi:NADH dehydrogenase [ubiquinone] 1 beta subcomplex subunit 5, mitochondrial [Condylostylus longicornis]|uniref:NADH dehydrogenase [ubiquinone] 1 beta subcomplex subunit 5, mitochondrial n=1 Tax=Condylostylus longicornis TaxID=2530218 RepID=UPI00244E1A89|nr:NADH dehydrogenase [ubiquinone] 1 beta subcomplex subunit 5, mitochondrial [Condylostylus longicornis]
MAILSSLFRSSHFQNTKRDLNKIIYSLIFKSHVNQTRNMSGGHHHFAIQPSRFQFKKFKDLLHYFVMLGVIPITAIVMYTNIFIGPAELREIPEGYVPKHWEYHKHPISRFLAQYVYPSPQQEYEKMCHFLYEENEKAQLRKLEAQIKEKMASRNDYQAYYYRPAIAKYHRISKEAADYLESIRGDN